jgi:hypothetical protein
MNTGANGGNENSDGLRPSELIDKDFFVSRETIRKNLSQLNDEEFNEIINTESARRSKLKDLIDLLVSINDRDYANVISKVSDRRKNNQKI